MAVETSAVQITINVVDPTSGEVIKNVTGNLSKLGDAGTRAGQQVRKGMEEAGAGGLGAREKLHLVTEELGIHMPRAFRSLIAESKTATAAINAVGGALMGLGAVQIGFMVFTQLSKGAQDLYEKWLDVDGAIEKYNRQAAEAATKKFDADRSLEQLNSDLRTANDLLAQLNQKRQNSPKWYELLGGSTVAAPGQIPNPALDHPYFGMGDTAKLNSAQSAVDAAHQEMAEKQHERILQQIQDSHELEAARATGIVQARVEREEANQIAIENQKYHVAQAQQLADIANRGKKAGDQGYLSVVPGAGDADRIAAQQHAQAIYQKSVIEFGRQQKKEAEEAAEKYDRQLTEYQKAVGRMMDKDDEDTAHYKELQERKTRDAQDFTDHVNRLVDEQAVHGLQGFARIHAEAQSAIDSLKAEAAAKGGNSADRDRGIAAIRSGEADQVGDQQGRNAQETAQIEAEARAKYLSAEKQQTAAIEAEYEERFAKYKKELDNTEISQNDFNRRVLAAAQLRDAEIEENMRQAREKMAGEFTRFFSSLDHPLKALQELGNKVAGQAAAAMVQRLQTHFGGSGAMNEHLGLPGGGIFDRIAGTPAASSGHISGAAGGSKSIALASADIQIQNANIGFGGGGGGGFAGGRGGGGGFNSVPGGVAFSGGGSYSSGGWTGFGAGAGGAGDEGWSGGGAGGGSFAGGPGMPMPQRNTAGGAVNNLGAGMSLFKQGASIFHSGGSTSGAPGAGASLDTTSVDGGLIPDGTQNFDVNQMAHGPSGFDTSMLGSGVSMSNVGGAASGALGLYSAYEGNGGVGGALSGAMSGMELGMSVGGPIGAAIGAAGGAILGAIGMGGREKARVYDLRTVGPGIAQEMQGYQIGSVDYLTAYSDMQRMDTDAERTTKQWGPAAHSYYNDTIRPEIAQARGKFDQMEKAGRSNYGMSSAQYATGTDSVPAMLTPGERVIPSDQNERITRALEAGSSGSRMPAQTGFGGDVHLHVHTMDTRGVKSFLDDNKHYIRSAVNASLAENSGGADAYWG